MRVCHSFERTARGRLHGAKNIGVKDFPANRGHARDSEMREFDFFFLPREVGDLSGVIVPPSMIIVCNELADEGILTLFNLNQALQYGSVGGIYFRSELSGITFRRGSQSDGSHFFFVDDLGLPEHLGLFAARPSLPALTRVSISLASGFSSANFEKTPTSPQTSGAFKSMKATLKARSCAFKVNGLDVLISKAGCEAIARGEANTGDASLDRLSVERSEAS